jgi:hypothetical protein
MLGTFTGKKLPDYVNATQADFVGARRTVNGTDRADLIARYARQYRAALTLAGFKAGKPAPVEKPATPVEKPSASATPPKPETPPAKPAGGFWHAIGRAILMWFGKDKT